MTVFYVSFADVETSVSVVVYAHWTFMASIFSLLQVVTFVNLLTQYTLLWFPFLLTPLGDIKNTDLPSLLSHKSSFFSHYICLFFLLKSPAFLKTESHSKVSQEL